MSQRIRLSGDPALDDSGIGRRSHRRRRAGLYGGRGLRALVPVATALILVLSGSIQVTLAQDDIELVPFEDETFAIRSVLPATWSTMVPGVHGRAGSVDDRTLLVLRSVASGTEEVWRTLLPQFGLEVAPSPIDTRETEAFDWTLFRFEGAAFVGDLVFDVALAESEGMTFVVLMQSPGAERSALYDAVFVPAVDAFERVEALPEQGRSVEVTFAGGDPGITLAGTLLLPEGDAPHAVVLLMSGIGPQDRDSSYGPVASIEPFALIATALADAGVATLRYDDRGIGASSGEHPSATVVDFTADGQAALDYLAAREDIDIDRIGLLGHSEGAIYAATIAAGDPRVAFVVGLAPPAVGGVELFVDQNVNAARALGATSQEVERVRDLSRRIYRAILDDDLPTAESLNREFYGQVWDSADPAQREALGERGTFVTTQVVRQMPVFASDWYRSFLEADPAADWAAIEVPMLGIFGARDTQVPAARNELALRSAAGRSGDGDLTTIILPTANHLFQAAETGLVAEYRSLGDDFSPDFLPALVEWVDGTVDALEGAP